MSTPHPPIIGFAWLAREYGIRLAAPLRVTSRIAGTKRVEARPYSVEQDFPAQYRPKTDSFADHFEFGLKHEELHLEFLSRLFQKVGPQPVLEWILSEPTGAYARRTAFLYEWFTGDRLDHPGVTNGGYVDAIDASQYLTRSADKVARWRINDNLPGTSRFCPLVRITDGVKAVQQFDIQQAIAELEETFGADLLLRSASWLTFKESRSSFLIEHEADKEVRIRRFAHAIAQYCGKIENPLTTKSLEILQKEILGDEALRYGLRQSPIFVGQDTISGTTVDYVAPPWEEIDGMMLGLQAFEAGTRGKSSAVRAAALAFAFVYIHPMKDGNGRIHRFLVNDLLSRDGVVPQGIILPISATISESSKNRADYDRVLDTFSKPFMRTYQEACKFGPTKVGPDGVPYSLHFTEYEDALHAWRYPDLTHHVEYMGQIIQSTILNEMREEASLLRKIDTARVAIKEVIEMPNADADRIIKSISSNNMAVSGKLRKEFPTIFGPEARPQLGQMVLAAVRQAFEEGEATEQSPVPTERQSAGG